MKRKSQKRASNRQLGFHTPTLCHPERVFCAKDLCTLPAALLKLKLAVRDRWLKGMLFEPLPAQVFPLRIHGHHQRDFLDPEPALDSLLAFDGIANVLEAFEINQTIQFVFRG